MRKVAPAAYRRPRYTPRVDIELREGPQSIAGLAGMLLALVDADLEAERAAAAGGRDQGDGGGEQRGEQNP